MADDLCPTCGAYWVCSHKELATRIDRELAVLEVERVGTVGTTLTGTILTDAVNWIPDGPARGGGL